MAWNEPETPGEPPRNKRPAGRSGGSGDDPYKQIQRWLEALVRGEVGGTGGPASSGGSEQRDGPRKSLALIAAAVAVVLWVSVGFFQVDASERAVIQRFGKFTGIRTPGLGWAFPWPIETVTKVNVSKVNSVEYRSRMLTADVNLVEIRSAIQYQYSDPVKILFQVRDPESTLREVSESAIREIVGQASLDQVLGVSRQRITEETRDLVQRTLDTYNSGIRVSSVNLTDVQVPEAVLASQRDANKAIEDRDRFSKEAQAYANDILPKAQGAAQRLVQDAEAYKSQVVSQAEGDVARFNSVYQAYQAAPEVTRQRMYIDAIESIMQRSRKVMIDSKSGANGNMLYLPLDKLLERGAVPRSASGEPGISSPTLQGKPAGELESVTIDGRDARARGER